WYVGLHDENPGQPGHWAKHNEILIDWLEGVAGEWVEDRNGYRCEVDFKAPEVCKEIHPVLADQAKTPQFFHRNPRVLTPAATTLFLDEVLQEFLAATDLLKRRAARDYSPDQHLQTLPEYRKAKPVARGASMTCFELFEAYVKAVKIRPSTVNRWRVV